MGLLKSVAKVGLAPSAFIGTQILKGIGLITKKDYGTTKEILASAVETKTGKALGGATALVGGALIGVAATTTAAGVAITKAVTSTASKILKATPAPIKTSVATGAITAGTIAILAPKTTEAILSSPEATKTAVATAINPIAGLVVGLEQGSGLLSEAIKTQAPRISEAIETAAPYAIGAGALTAAAVGATQILKEKEISADLPKSPVEIIDKGSQPNKAVEAPVLPQTQTITSTPSKKRKKTRSKAQPAQIKQSVGINIINNNSAHRITKKYINAIALRN